MNSFDSNNSCINGKNCLRLDCQCSHPTYKIDFDMEDVQKNKECLSNICYNKTCNFEHTNNQKIHFCFGCHLDKLVGIEISGLNYCSRKCFETIPDRCENAIISHNSKIKRNIRYHQDSENPKYYN